MVFLLFDISLSVCIATGENFTEGQAAFLAFGIMFGLAGLLITTILVLVKRYGRNVEESVEFDLRSSFFNSTGRGAAHTDS